MRPSVIRSTQARKKGTRPESVPWKEEMGGEERDLPSVVGAEEADHDALDHEFPGGNQVGVGGVLGAEERLAVVHKVPLEGCFPVHEAATMSLGRGSRCSRMT